MEKIKLSLKPLKPARWETHEPTGVKFLIAPLIGEEDQDLTDQSSNMMGVVNPMQFARLAAPKVLRDWQHVSDANGTAVACNPENIKEFVTHHGVTIMPWVIRRARSIDHYRTAEVEEAKKD